MLIDSRLLGADEVIETDVCVIGTGPAGLTLAHELADQPFRVGLLESGGLRDEVDTSGLSAVETPGDFLQVTPDSRNREFGGNSRFWAIQLPGGAQGVRHRPLDPVDFETRDWIPHSGWPFDRAHLDPFYERAQRRLGMGRYAYDGADWADAEHPVLPLTGDRLTTRVFQFSLGKLFFNDQLYEVSRSRNITAYLHATVAELVTDEAGGAVTRVRVARDDGSQLWVHAKVFILATGGLETAQLMLLSNGVHRDGLANQHDLVGRFFMDHPLVRGGVFVPSDPGLMRRAGLYDLREVDGSFVMGTLGLSDETIRREHLSNISSSIFPRSKYFVHSPAKDALRGLLSVDGLRSGAASGHVATIVDGRRDLLEFARGKLTRIEEPTWYGFFQGGWIDDPRMLDGDFQMFDVLHQTEQWPDPDNRIVLSDARDPLGRRRIRVQSRWRDEDIEGVQRAQRVFAEEIERAGLGHFSIYEVDDRPLLEGGGTAHHLGTTRMHDDPTKGVVDPTLKVHGVDNLYVASSSVFPTGGYANPTFTIVALSIRLADRVKTLMATVPTAPVVSSD